MSFTSSISGFFDSVGRARQAQNKYMSLSSMSDRKLASQGLKRQDIARIAFQDILDH